MFSFPRPAILFQLLCYRLEKRVKLVRHYRVSKALYSVHPMG
jgi:hypothetical protein